LTVLFLISSCNAQKSMIDKTVVKEFEIEKYLGTWYEIARFDHSFERDLAGVTATYSFREDGKIKVVNSGYKGSLNGPKSDITGKAKIPNPAVPSKLKVSFFLFFYGDYYVLELDREYQWAAVGSSSDKFLWILSRSPQMDENLYTDITNKLAARGYDTSKLIRVEQKSD
jgi:apolipoprotein D and lipocalin family protein